MNGDHDTTNKQEDDIVEATKFERRTEKKFILTVNKIL